jgi:CHASE3 domain sensor protein
VLRAEDERLNDDINAVLRDAAEQLEVRTRAEAAEDTAAARRQFDAVVALARARPSKPRH